MRTNEKSQTIKIDIRSLGYSRAPVVGAREGAGQKDYFDALDYRFLFDHAYDAIVLADGAGKVLAANARAVRITKAKSGKSCRFRSSTTRAARGCGDRAACLVQLAVLCGEGLILWAGSRTSPGAEWRFPGDCGSAAVVSRMVLPGGELCRIFW